MRLHLSHYVGFVRLLEADVCVLGLNPLFLSLVFYDRRNNPARMPMDQMPPCRSSLVVVGSGPCHISRPECKPSDLRDLADVGVNPSARLLKNFVR